jgi:coproporphyrinogen III oxidase-like Fe-S oxidoreductase
MISVLPEVGSTGIVLSSKINIYIHIYICKCICEYLNTNFYARMNVCIHTQTSVYILHLHIQINNLHKYIFMNICIDICKCINVLMAESSMYACALLIILSDQIE